MGMTLKEICDLTDLPCPPDGERTVQSVTEDSRRARPGALFVAVAGEKADGHDFAQAAIDAGAVAIIGDRQGLTELAGVPYLYTAVPRRAAGIVAHRLAGDPAASMVVLGVTGTNGKTSTAHLTQAILTAAGHRTANFGTLGYDLGGTRRDAAHTTPFGEDLAACFADALAAGCTHAVMEVSSHALAQDRVAGIPFTGAGFTNLTQDHLDYHQDMDQYREAKLKLFRELAREDAFGVVNLDDPAGRTFRDACPVKTYTYGQRGDCRATRVKTGFGGTDFMLHTPWGDGPARLGLLGHHNVANALCAVGLAGGIGVGFDDIRAGLAALGAVPGRFEAVDCGQPFYVIVDYAHTEDGLKNVLAAARSLCKGRVITVFGCGGDRDKTKRPKMGFAAASQSDFAVLTSDNPRTEDPHRILLDIEVGVQRTGKKKHDHYLVIENREEAIGEALVRARDGDLVLIAGKGHEDYQILGTEKIHFDDREVARKHLGADPQ